MRSHPLADALVVGAGPAGSAFAAELVRRGFEPVVVDRAHFPRVKPCGESVNAGAVAALGRLGFLAAVQEAQPAPIRTWHIGGPGQRCTARSPGGFGIERSAFDAALVDVVRGRGVRVYEGWRVTGVARRRGVWSIDARQGSAAEQWRARLLVGADGLRSVVSRRLGLTRPAAWMARRRKASFTFRLRGVGPERDAGQLYLDGNVTVGLVPVRGQEPLWNGTVVFNLSDRSRSGCDCLTDRAREALARAPFGWTAGPDTVGGPWTSGPFDQPVRSAVADGVMLVGDAAGYFDPLTGQGIFRALRSSELAADTAAAALEAADVTASVLGEYARRWRREVRAPRGFQRVVDVALRHGASRRAAFRAMARWPALADNILGVTGDHLPVGALLRPGVGYASAVAR